MNPILGNLIAVLVLALVVMLAAWSVRRNHRRGGHCDGNCASCGYCRGEH